MDEQTDLDSIFYDNADTNNITTTYVLSMNTNFLEGIYTLKGKPKQSHTTPKLLCVTTTV